MVLLMSTTMWKLENAGRIRLKKFATGLRGKVLTSSSYGLHFAL